MVMKSDAVSGGYIQTLHFLVKHTEDKQCVFCFFVFLYSVRKLYFSKVSEKNSKTEQSCEEQFCVLMG